MVIGGDSSSRDGGRSQAYSRRKGRNGIGALSRQDAPLSHLNLWNTALSETDSRVELWREHYAPGQRQTATTPPTTNIVAVTLRPMV